VASGLSNNPNYQVGNFVPHQVDDAMADPGSAVKVAHAARLACRENVDALLFQVMAAITRQYRITLLNAGQTIDEVNEQLPAFVQDIEAQRQKIINDVVRFLDDTESKPNFAMMRIWVPGTTEIWTSQPAGDRRTLGFSRTEGGVPQESIRRYERSKGSEGP
jgi:hypothetical protein